MGRHASPEADRLYARLATVVGKELTVERSRHSAAVAQLAGQLCLRFGFDPMKGRLAGIGHDIAREMGGDETLAYVRRFRLRASAWEREHPVTLHGAVGRDLLRREYGLRDREILSAVSEHVLGRPGMRKLSRIIYAADFLEPGRGFLDDGERTALLALGLDEMVARVSERIFMFLEAEGKPIAPVSKKMYDYFRRRRSKRQ